MGGKLGHDNGDGDVEKLAMVGEAQGVIAGAGSDDAVFFLFGGELEELVAGAAFLEAAGHLEVVELAVDFGRRRAWRGRGSRGRGNGRWRP